MNVFNGSAHLYKSLRTRYLTTVLTTCTCTALSIYATDSTIAPKATTRTDRNFWYALDALYLKPWEAGVVVTNAYAPVLTTADFTQNQVSHPHFNWAWGFRFGFGYFFIPPKWSFDLDWTHFNTTVSQTQSTSTNDATDIDQLGSFPIWDIENTTIAGDYVNNSYLLWKLSLNLLDLNFDRSFQLHRFCLKPFVGLRSGWIRQKFDVEYSGGIFTQTFISSGVNVNGTYIIKMKNNYWGLGPRIGFAPSVLLGKGIGIYGDVAISALMGVFHLGQEGKYLGNTTFNIDSNPFGLRWILDLAAGLSYCISIFTNRYDLSFKLGYEFYAFYHQMGLQKDQFNIVPHNPNLSLQGVIANVRMDF